jgi:hypothetical protein
VNKVKLTVAERKTIARQKVLGWRLMAAAGACWAVAVVLHPLGISLLGKGGLFMLVADAFALISLGTALVSALNFRPWRNDSRTRAILLILLTIILSDLFLLTWDWRIPG